MIAAFNKCIKTISFAPLLIICISCINPAYHTVRKNYTPLHVGDFRQFLDLTDSSTIQMEITGTTVRSDGQTVFIETYQIGNDTPMTNYYYCDDTFLISCDGLDTLIDTAGNPILYNPFGEQRLAMKNPENNYTWKQCEEDTFQLIRKARQVEQMTTSLGTFQNVYAFELYDSITDQTPFMVNCYVESIGFIHTYFGHAPDSLLFKAVYFNIDNNEKGTKIAPRDRLSGISKHNKSEKIKKALLNGIWLSE